MSLMFLRAQGTAVVTPTTAPTLDVPLLHARIAWRSDALTDLAWDGASTAGWTVIGSTLSSTSSDSFGGGSSLELVTAGTAGSGVTYAMGTATYASGREYRLRVGARNVSGSTSLVLTLGDGADAASSTATTTTDWAWYTVDWTPSGDRTSVDVSLTNGAAATQTVRFDHVEVYESACDVTLASLRVTRGSRYDGGREAPGTLDFSILDPDDTYTPRNSASPLYPYVNPGRKVHIRATRGGRLYAIGYGTVKSVTPDPYTKTVSFTCEDGLAELDGYTVDRLFATDLSYAAARAAALSGEALGTAQHALATDSVEGCTFIDGTDTATSLLDYLESLNEATGTVHFCAPHVEAYRPWRYTTVTRATLTDETAGVYVDEDFQRLEDVSARDESLITKQRVTWQGYEHRGSAVVAEATQEVPYLVYTDEVYGSTDYPEPEEVFRLKRVRGRKKRHRRKLRYVGLKWTDPLVPITFSAQGQAYSFVIDWLVPVEDVSVGVTNQNSLAGLTTTTSDEVGRTLVTLTAGTAHNGAYAVVTDVAATAAARLPLDEVEEIAGSGAHEGSPIDSERWPSSGQAYGMADYITWRYGSGRLRPSVTDQHKMARQLTLGVGDHVTLSADRWYIDAVRCVVRSLEHDVSEKGMEWETTYGLEELPTALAWFRLDSSTLDSSAVLAH